jgi:tetratricopeptide (TPR) repeat protein
LAELFPDHFYAAGNSAFWCGAELGRRADFTRYAILAADPRPEFNSLAAMALALLDHNFDGARPYYERARERSLDQYDILDLWRVAYIELFPAEELLHLGMLPEVMSELERVEGLLDSLDPHFRYAVVRKLALFHLSLGQFRKALELTATLPANWHPGIWPAWCAYLRGDRSAFELHVETAYADLEMVMVDPGRMALRQLRANLRLWFPSLPIEVLAPLYDPESAVEDALQSDAPDLIDLTRRLTGPKLEARLQLVRGKKLLDEGRIRQALPALGSGMRWFSDNGDWETFSYFFLGAELRAEAYASIGNLVAAHLELEDAARQLNLVNSYTLPQHQKVRARLASLAREMGRFDEARSLEAELAEELRLADEDHPILLKIGEHRDTAPAR